MKSGVRALIVFAGAVFLLALPPGVRAQGDLQGAGNNETEAFNDSQGSDPSAKNEFLFEGLYTNLFVLNKGRDGLPGSEPSWMAGDLNRLRLSPEYRQGEALTLRLDFDTEAVFSNYRQTPAFDALWIPSTYNEPFPGIYEIKGKENPYVRMKIHRAYAKYTAGMVTATAGRQQIRFGSGRLWNPLDILNPVSPTALEGAGEQRGVDGVRADLFFDELTELTAAWVPGLRNDSFRGSGIRDHNSMLRFKRAAEGFEAAFIGGYIAKRAAAGADLSAAVYDGTLRGAVMGFRPERGKSFICAGAGYEYTFRNGIHFIAEYFYNSSSLGSDPLLLTEYSRSAYTGADQASSEALANRFLTWNSHYAGAGAGYDLHPLVRTEGYLIADIEGRGIFFSPSVRYSALENLDLSLAAMTGKVFRGSDKYSDFEELEGAPVLMVSATGYF